MHSLVVHGGNKKMYVLCVHTAPQQKTTVLRNDLKSKTKNE